MTHQYRIQKNDLIFRPVEKIDIEKIRIWRNIEGIRKSFLYQEIISFTEQEAWYNDYANKVDDIMFLIEHKGIDVGTVALYNIDTNKRQAEFGRLMIGEETARGLKLGRQAVEEMCKFASEKLGLNTIILEVFDDNQYARKAYEEVGFKLVNSRNMNSKKIMQMKIENLKQWKEDLI
jgi:RimJ/RimL family protein N-acetyltransferase